MTQPPDAPQDWQPPAPPSAAPPPYPSYPPAQAWVPPVAPKRSRRTLWIVLALVFVVVAGCAGVVGTLAFRAGQGADHAANAFLNAAERGDTATALSIACPETTAENVPVITHHKVRGIQVNRGNGQTTAQVKVDVTFPDATVHQDVIYLEKDDGRWLVCGAERLK